jgi:hypothetical protein
VPIATQALGGIIVGQVTARLGGISKGFAIVGGLVFTGVLQSALERRILNAELYAALGLVMCRRAVLLTAGCNGLLTRWLAPANTARGYTAGMRRPPRRRRTDDAVTQREQKSQSITQWRTYSGALYWRKGRCSLASHDRIGLPGGRRADAGGVSGDSRALLQPELRRQRGARVRHERGTCCCRERGRHAPGDGGRRLERCSAVGRL